MKITNLKRKGFQLWLDYRYRPSGGHTGPIRRSTHIDEVPFLAVARALGDLWSYNSKEDVYVVSPDPDLHVYDLNILKDRLVLALKFFSVKSQHAVVDSLIWRIFKMVTWF